MSLTYYIIHVWLALICLLPSLMAELVRPWCPNQCALINVEAPGFGTLVVQGSNGAKEARFQSWDTAVPKGFIAESAYFSSRISHSEAS